MAKAPLDGIRILEVEGIGPGPFAAMMLADLGADVIVAHRPRTGPAIGIKERPVIDRGKRSIVLDLKGNEDRDVFLGLMKGADGLIEGFRPGVMERLQLGPADCHAINPRLVYGRMTGWGQDGPLATQAGHDLNYLSVAGALWAVGREGQGPSVPPTVVGDIGGGALYLVSGMLAGFLSAARTGMGTVVDAAISDGAAHMQNLLLSIEGGVEDAASRRTNPLVGAHWSRTYACADGRHISVQCLEPKFYTVFLDRMGLSDDADFRSNQFDAVAWPRLSERLSAMFLEQDASHWDAVFAGTDACVARVLSPKEAQTHPHNQERGTWLETSDGLQAAPAPRFLDREPLKAQKISERNAHGVAIRAALAAGDGWSRH
ncbi:CaiB/BaiF CoA transferase family protein [Marivita hallyeonensis]|uniref:Crotonobetainyl-CoA:carnitine CoA-transferase CaiB n=1 Tax=Marivita hallyeonensis TaxID=996342 RepID=A0A1M5X1E8_9RHOB|nr:CaiB/BaiF CoA-transferase family protein [Marivita hallyeonensis]SHH93368.1 Crotonobetainyl-CoA:carnitine CoA-transferase CaiB [Marivita hallyeonensis]